MLLNIVACGLSFNIRDPVRKGGVVYLRMLYTELVGTVLLNILRLCIYVYYALKIARN